MTETSGATDPEAEPELTRVCRKCSAQTTGAGDYCPHCGARYEKRGIRFGKRAKIIIATLLVLLLAGGATAAILVKNHNDKVARQHRLAAQRAARAKAEARRRERERRALQRARDRLQVSLRRTMVRDLERSITKDARKDVSDGLFDGPIIRSECTPVAGGNTDDLAQHTGAYSCMAVNKLNGDGTEEGYRFSATINYDDASYTWHLGG